MDWLFGLVLVGGVGYYVVSRMRRRPTRGPEAAQEVERDGLPAEIRSLIEEQGRARAKYFHKALDVGGTVAFGHTPGNDRIDVFGLAADGTYRTFQFSLAERAWKSAEKPDAEPEVMAVIRDTFR